MVPSLPSSLPRYLSKAHFLSEESLVVRFLPELGVVWREGGREGGKEGSVSVAAKEGEEAKEGGKEGGYEGG